jgi:hypothetical protein
MSDLYKNPQDSPQDEALESRNSDMTDWGGSKMEPAGPAGNSTLSNANEKGILETGLFRAMGLHQTSELGSEHRSFREGIYGDQGPSYGD